MIYSEGVFAGLLAGFGFFYGVNNRSS